MRKQQPQFAWLSNSCSDCANNGTHDCVPCTKQGGCLNHQPITDAQEHAAERADNHARRIFERRLQDKMARMETNVRGGYQQAPIAYVCSPYRGDVERNVAYAKEIMAQAIRRGFAPITPHLYIPAVLDDNDPIERRRGLDLGLALLKVCDYVVVGCRYGISDGMRDEIKTAMELAKGIVLLDNDA